MNISYQTNNVPKILFLMIITALVLVPITYITVVNNGNTHAIDKHSLDTVTSIQFCLNNNGELQLWQKDNRFARLCQVKDGLYGIEIVEKNGNLFEHVTAFFKDKMHSLNQVENYLDNTGYVRIK